ncbi:MAG: hypothetical protein KGY75_09190 [Candidatus Cloacimonetes bacterium]|nr:hypothetical protein [Candidatus Cloacimonadota bacterium]MBS3768273.1 hypothetical protein [Candidatus Cloacimonadota bacterium]
MELELKILIDVIKRLKNLEIPYMITGSVAMNFYTEPRMTRDIDIIVEIKSEEKGKFLHEFGDEYIISETAITEALRYNYLFNIIHKKFVFKVDFIIRKTDEYSKIAFSNRKLIDVDKQKIVIISKEDLIIAKIAWSQDSRSIQQKTDVIKLLQTNPDLVYIKKWLRNLNLYKFAEEFIGERYF